MSELIEWVSNQGFAIGIAVYLIVRIDTKLDKLIVLLEKVLAQ